MKKLFILFICLTGLQSCLRADDDKSVAVNELPEETQTFIKTHFPTTKVAYAKMESDFFKKDYKVIFSNGEKATFDKHGKWKEIDCKYSSVPASILPDGIKRYVEEQFPGQYVIEIEQDRKGYEVKLKNRLELKFDTKCRIVKIDD